MTYLEKSRIAMTAVYVGRFFILCFLIYTASAQFYGQPEQIHLSYGVDPSIMVVTWTTFSSTKPAFAEYGPTRDTMVSMRAVETKFVDSGELKRSMYIYKAWMKNVVPGNKYVYRVGSAVGWSAVFSFIAQRNDSGFQPQFVLIGDLGNSNAQSLPRLQLDTEAGMYDAMLHIGDFAYNLASDNALVGDEFMRQMQPIASQIPYMTCPGNHEYAYNFSNYKHRFTMPHDEYGQNMFYSIDIGPVHLISFSSEYSFFWNFGFWQFFYQYKWLEEDLMRASQPEARAKRPWIITMAHRPMYCSNLDFNDCTRRESLMRTGLPIIHKFGYEELFYKYGVDLSFWAHEHSYERLLPIYNYSVRNGSYEKPYTNPKGIVHIITGSAGCSEKHNIFKFNKPAWSAFRSNDYSYTRMKVFNASHLYLETVSDDQHGKVIDKMMLIKDKHGPYN